MGYSTWVRSRMTSLKKLILSSSGRFLGYNMEYMLGYTQTSFSYLFDVITEEPPNPSLTFPLKNLHRTAIISRKKIFLMQFNFFFIFTSSSLSQTFKFFIIFFYYFILHIRHIIIHQLNCRSTYTLTFSLFYTSINPLFA